MHCDREKLEEDEEEEEDDDDFITHTKHCSVTHSLWEMPL